MIRKAQIDEVPEIRRILLAFSNKWDVLPRTMADLYSSLRDYYVYREPHGQIMGVVALHIFWEDLGEIRSLAVAPESQKKGIGTRLVHRCLEEARQIGLRRVFVLTSQLDYFHRFGFQEVPKDELPRIIWAECKDCVKFPDCDEIPMVLNLAAGI